MKVNIGDFLIRRATLSPTKIGLVCDDVRLTFGEMNDRANRLANAMTKMGVKHGDTVALLAFNEKEYYDMYFGLGKIGAILTPVNYRLAGPEMAYILDDCKADVFVFSKDFIEIVDSFRNAVPAEKFIAISDSPPEWADSFETVMNESSAAEPELTGGDDDTLTILYTSGTTGRPKGAELTHNYFFWTSVNMMSTLGVTVGDSSVIALPLFHIGGLAGLPWGVHQGMKIVLQRSFDPQGFLEIIQEEKISGFGAVPVLLDFLKLVPDFEKYDFSSVQTILVYAAPVPVTLIEEYNESGIEVRQLYGMTEGCQGTVLDSENAISKAGSCGRPFFHTEIRVVDEKGVDVEPEVKGEVLLRSQVMMKRYWNKPEATADTIKDGWLYSGDIGRMDKDGFLYIMDRKKDMIISGGENIYPAEVEDYLLRNLKLADVAVIGYNDDRWGESVRAVVVVKPGEQLTEQELINWCQDQMGKFKIPKSVIIVDAIPRTPTGKILKKDLREQYNK
ncbi:MAG: long-chain fatty acid--CoA ligase [Deltaproteobacteria bacterium]|nr:long-chain fatty acid--CoA ligase [Deltaproteobacteria bacterium]MBT4089932.1 long-chain fatty acid--CoA ligase [Deltaproteobacteria bacterium]MBT4268623.1 long-chain fatty acid--CoA ligase [Deltaproteobacteria bacterium]MBT4642706.1 long-chain fatty acid--CoA ligase [Deltaproteobacteria bacterium]MBT6499562.1 long-chain fatty acid--CoA ligase [Deltaproteobacteria bacterium]